MMFSNSGKYSILSRAISVLLIHAFFLSSLAQATPINSKQEHSLARWTASEDYQVRRKALAELYRKSRMTYPATSRRHLELLARKDACALLLPSGMFLMAPRTIADDLLLIQSVTHQSIQMLMQREKKLHPARYERLMDYVLGNKEIIKSYAEFKNKPDSHMYLEILEHSKKRYPEKRSTIFNDLIATAFELLFVVDQRLLGPETRLADNSGIFLGLMWPILEAKDSRSPDRTFPQVFFDHGKRMKLIRALQKDRGERFHSVSSTSIIKEKLIGREKAEYLVSALRHEDPSVRKAAAAALVSMNEMDEYDVPRDSAVLGRLYQGDIEWVAGNVAPVHLTHKFLTYPIDEIRLNAANAFALKIERGYWGGDLLRLIEPLKNDKCKNVRQAVAEALGMIDNPIARRYSSLHKGDIGWIVREGVPQVPYLIEALGSGPEVRQNAANALGKIDHPEAKLYNSLYRGHIDWIAEAGVSRKVNLIEALGSGPEVRRSSLQVLSRIYGRGITAVLLEALEHKDENVRLCAVEVLGRMRNPETTEQLIQTVENDKNADVMQAAAQALGNIDSPRAELYSCLHQGDIDRITGKGSAQVEALIEVVESGSIFSKEAIHALGQLRDSRAVSILLKVLRDEHSFDRTEAAKALGKIGDRTVVRPLIQVLGSLESEWGLHESERAAIIWALGELGDTRAIVPLLGCLGSEASEALGKIGKPAVKPLVALAGRVATKEKEEPGPSYSDVHNIFSALSRIGEPSVESLIGFLTNKDDRVRKAAARALGNIGPKAEKAVPALLERLSDPKEQDHHRYELRQISHPEDFLLYEYKLSLLKICAPRTASYLDNNDSRALHLYADCVLTDTVLKRFRIRPKDNKKSREKKSKEAKLYLRVIDERVTKMLGRGINPDQFLRCALPAFTEGMIDIAQFRACLPKLVGFFARTSELGKVREIILKVTIEEAMKKQPDTPDKFSDFLNMAERTVIKAYISDIAAAAAWEKGKGLLELTEQDFAERGLGWLLEEYYNGSARALCEDIYDTIDKKIIRGTNQLPHDKTIVIYAPHPDDDVIPCGGLMWKLSRPELNNRVIVLFALSGNTAVRGRNPKDPEQRKLAVKTRKKEAIEACKHLGARGIFLKLPLYDVKPGDVKRDGSIAREKREMCDRDIDKVEQCIVKINPDIAVLPGDLNDPHGGHLAAYNVWTKAINRVNLAKPVTQWLYRAAWAEYTFTQADMLVTFGSDIMQRNIEAINLHTSQLDPVWPGEPGDPMDWFREFAERALAKKATMGNGLMALGFFAQDQARRGCLPEDPAFVRYDVTAPSEDLLNPENPLRKQLVDLQKQKRRDLGEPEADDDMYKAIDANKTNEFHNPKDEESRSRKRKRLEIYCRDRLNAHKNAALEELLIWLRKKIGYDGEWTVSKEERMRKVKEIFAKYLLFPLDAEASALLGMVADLHREPPALTLLQTSLSNEIFAETYVVVKGDKLSNDVPEGPDGKGNVPGDGTQRLPTGSSTESGQNRAVPAGINSIQHAFAKLNGAARKVSQLNAEVSRLHGTSQKLMNVTKFRFCVPIEILRNSADIMLALNSTGLLKRMPEDKENIEFELVVTGIRADADIRLVDKLRDEINKNSDIKKALNLPNKFILSMITESRIQYAADSLGYDISTPKDRTLVIKDFHSGKLADGEYLAIATDALDSVEEADDLVEELEREHKKKLAEENISICVVVRPELDKSMYSLSKIFNNWFKAITQGNFSTISKILPVPAPLTPELEQAIKEAWAVLTAV